MQYVLSQIIGDGTGEIIAGSEDTTGPFRPVAGLYGDYVAVIPPDETVCLVKVVNEDLTALNADNRCRVIPGDTLDDVLGTVAANVANNWLTTRGYPALATAGMTKGELVEAFGDYISPGWSLAQPFNVDGQ